MTATTRSTARTAATRWPSSGSRADEAFRLSPNGARVRLVRDVGGVVMSLGELEQVDVRAAAGADTLTTDELSGTTLQAVTGDLGAADGATDRVVVNATQFDDTVDVAGADGTASVIGVAVPVTLAGAEAGRDQLQVNALAGFDRVASAGAPGHHVRAHRRRRRRGRRAGRRPGRRDLARAATASTRSTATAATTAPSSAPATTASPGTRATAATCVEGQDGMDTMTFNGSGVGRDVHPSSTAARASASRATSATSRWTSTTSSGSTPRGSAEATSMMTFDVSGTDLTALRFAMGTDGAADEVFVDSASNGADAIAVTGAIGAANVDRPPGGFMLAMSGAQVDDRLIVNGRGGDDTIDASALAADAVRLAIDGGAGADTMRGGRGPDLLQGGDGADDVDGNQGDDIALLGAGDDRFTWDPGDGSDTLEGEGGADTLSFNGAARAGDLRRVQERHARALRARPRQHRDGPRRVRADRRPRRSAARTGSQRTTSPARA